MFKFISILIIAILFTQCSTDPFEPIDIFEEEIITVDEFGNVVDNGENVMLPVGELCNGVQLFANKERVQQLPGGFQIKGTVFAETDEGITSISSGDFTIDHNRSDELSKFTGFGSFLLPDNGLFGQSADLSDLFGANLQYGAGQAFIKQDESLPLQEEDCYFKLTLEESSGFAPGGSTYPMLIGNTALSFNTIYLQPQVPAILVKGDMDQYEVKDKPAKVVEGADGKKKFKPASQSVKKKWSIKDVHIGIAAKPHFKFKPKKFSDELEEIVGGTNFKEFDGHLYLKGTIPLKKYPIDIKGEAVIQNDFSPLGAVDLFDRGFTDAAYRMGINGTAEFGHTILDFLPVDTRVELGNVTLQLNVDGEETFLRFAGEYETDILGEILGEELSKVIPRQTQSGKVYANIGTELNEWQYYFEQKLSMNMPGIGVQELSETIIHVTPDQIYLSAMSTLPFGIGETKISGRLNRNGQFELLGIAKANLEMGDARMAADLKIQINNDGLFVEGMASLPGGISDFAIAGEISKDEVSISGWQMTNIDFGGGAKLKTDLQLTASTKTGIFLFGAMETPLDVVAVVVEGRVSAQGLALGGKVKAKVDFGVTKLQSDIQIIASTWDGAKLRGNIDVPLAVIGGNFNVTGCITGPTSFRMEAYGSVGLDFSLASAEVNFCLRFSDDDIKIGGGGEFCAAQIFCAEYGVLFNPNWSTGQIKFCVILGVRGEDEEGNETRSDEEDCI